MSRACTLRRCPNGQPCLICKQTPRDAHHRITSGFHSTQSPGRKLSDEFTVPLCRSHHQALQQAAARPSCLIASSWLRAPAPGSSRSPALRFATARRSDTFTMETSCENRKQRGTSVIVVDVHAR
ncbi:DUF968 domain-containing protein [Bradyrhizobium sp. DASA03076]|uniref:DUF968 domain-containing protein n=1 Tax=Bradyrhizobium sp. BLXBL-03 TaxID=3395916 RepID=UPI003F70982E